MVAGSGSSGSSPLARGLRRVIGDRVAGVRIIPARAGFTPSAMALRRAREDHPRSRGVYANPGGLPSAAGGSSPLARGLQGKVSPAGMVRGIIPARAGFTDHPPDRNRGRPDHPRSRGVYANWFRDTIKPIGSSPLARGLRQAGHGPGPRPRIIPARAGFTLPPPWRRRAGRDHPRSRGVYLILRPRVRLRPGSSPLARGLRHSLCRS